MKVGRVLRTGLDVDGRSAAIEDRVIDPRTLPSGRQLTELWADGNAGTGPGGMFPGPGGVRYWLLTLPADDPDAPPHLHATPTLDLGVLVAGRLRLILEDGSSTELAPGDALVQTGTAHAWHNPGPENAVLAVVVLGAA